MPGISRKRVGISDQDLRTGSQIGAARKVGAAAGTVVGTAMGVAVLGPVGLIPAAFFGLMHAGLNLWEHLSNARTLHAEAEASEAEARARQLVVPAEARTLVARHRLEEAAYRAATSEVNSEQVIELAVRTALGAARGNGFPDGL
jgi:hypothetical protein